MTVTSDTFGATHEKDLGGLRGGRGSRTGRSLGLPALRVAGKTGGKLRCHFIDMVPVFEGHNPEWFNNDIHPNSMGSKAMAEKIWEVMTERCIAQKAGATCCEP